LKIKDVIDSKTNPQGDEPAPINEYFLETIVAIETITGAAPFHSVDGQTRKALAFELGDCRIDQPSPKTLALIFGGEIDVEMAWPRTDAEKGE
jgi:hypothetical protein